MYSRGTHHVCDRQPERPRLGRRRLRSGRTNQQPAQVRERAPPLALGSWPNHALGRDWVCGCRESCAQACSCTTLRLLPRPGCADPGVPTRVCRPGCAARARAWPTGHHDAPRALPGTARHSPAGRAWCARCNHGPVAPSCTPISASSGRAALPSTCLLHPCARALARCHLAPRRDHTVCCVRRVLSLALLPCATARRVACLCAHCAPILRPLCVVCRVPHAVFWCCVCSGNPGQHTTATVLSALNPGATVAKVSFAYSYDTGFGPWTTPRCPLHFGFCFRVLNRRGGWLVGWAWGRVSRCGVRSAAWPPPRPFRHGRGEGGGNAHTAKGPTPTSGRRPRPATTLPLPYSTRCFRNASRWPRCRALPCYRAPVDYRPGPTGVGTNFSLLVANQAV